MTAMREPYKGCFLDPKVFELRDNSGWTAEVYVAENEGNDVIDTRFILKGIFPSEEAARKAAIRAGMQVVDRQDIHSVIEESTQLPSTPRRAYGSHSDDLATGKDGYRKGVPSSGNPDDRFS